MKKSIFALGLMFAALTLTNCTKNEEENIVPETKGQAFELFANADTRTTIDGVATSWDADDALNVFHADAGTTTYTKDNKFSIAEADVASGRFTGTLAGTLEEGKNYDWYISYPYNVNIKSPNATQGWMTVGSAHNASQTQNGNNSMAHICGENYPLCAKVLNVAATDKVAFEKMNHLTSVVKVKVTNTESEAITVSKVSFATSSNDIVGTYKINITGDDVAYTASGASYVSKTASLDVVGGTSIEKDANAEFYLGIKPFTAAAGETLTITVSTDKGDCVKTLELKTATTFTAGKIKTLNFGFVAQKPKIYELVSGTSEKLNAGDEVIIVAAPSDFAISTAQNDNNRGQVDVTKDKNAGTITITNKDNNVQIFKLENGTKTGSFAFKTINGDNIGYIYAASSSNNHLRTEYPMTDNSSWNVTFDGNNANIVAQGTNSHNTLKYNSSSKLFSCYTGGQQNVQIYRLSDGKTKLAKPQINDNFTINAEQITASWTGDNNAQGYYWKLCKGNDILKEVEKTTDTSITIKATDIVGLTQFEEGVKYVLYVKSLGDGENYKDSEEASKEISFGGTSGGNDVTASLTLSNNQKFATTSGSTLTDDKGNIWTVAHTNASIQNSYNTTYKGQQFGTGSTNGTITFSTTINKPIKSISITAAAGGTKATVELSVNNIIWQTNTLSKTSQEYTVKGNGQGEILIIFKQNEKKAVYLGAIKVVYEE